MTRPSGSEASACHTGLSRPSVIAARHSRRRRSVLAEIGRDRPSRSASVPARRYASLRSHARFRHLRPRPRPSRPPLRWALLHGRANDRHLLPPGVPGEAGAVRQRLVLSDRSRGRAGGLPALPALPARDGAVLAGLAGVRGDRIQGHPHDRRRVPRRAFRRRAGRAGRHRSAPSRAPVSASRGNVAARGRQDGANPEGEEAARHHGSADHRDRLRRRLRQHPPLQRGVSGDLRDGAFARPQAQEKR